MSMHAHDYDDFEYVPGAVYENWMTLRSRMFTDMIPDQFLASNAKRLGLPPTSPDVAEAERHASQSRSIRVKELLPVIMTLSGLSMEAMREAIVLTGGTVEIPQEFLALLIASNVTVVSNLVDLGVLALPGESHGALG